MVAAKREHFSSVEQQNCNAKYSPLAFTKPMHNFHTHLQEWESPIVFLETVLFHELNKHQETLLHALEK